MKNLNGQYCFTHPAGEAIYLFTLTNERKTSVSITNYGAIITSFKVLQSNGTFNDVVLGFDKVEDYFSQEYLAGYPYFGCAIGRYANRIKNGEFSIDGRKYVIAKNKSGDHLHGGWEGFDKKAWNYVSGSEQELTLKYISRDGEEGYPGNLQVELHFQLTDDDELIYEFIAETDQPTAINLTHHSYFNLNNGNGMINAHSARIYASAMLEQDDNFVVTGTQIPVAGSNYDFRELKKTDKDWIPDDGYDQSFVLDKEPGDMQLAAELIAGSHDFKLEVYTTEPVVHFYTGKWIPPVKGKNGSAYGPFSGLCFETHQHPNAINIPAFPNTILRPGETYQTKTKYRIIH